MRKLAILLSSFVITLGYSQEKSGAEIVKIYSSAGTGSGVIICYTDNNYYILTAAHNTDPRLDDYSIIFSNKADTAKATLFRTNLGNYDLAILKMNTPFLKDVKVLSSFAREHSEGDDVFLYGFPAGGDQMRFDGIAGKAINEKLYFSGIKIEEGISGSALIRKSDGNIVGIVTNRPTDEQDENQFAIKSSIILDLIKDDNRLCFGKNNLIYHLDFLEFYEPNQRILNFFEGIDLMHSKDQIVETVKTHNERWNPTLLTESQDSYSYQIRNFQSTAIGSGGNSSVFANYNFINESLASMQVRFEFESGFWKTTRLNKKVNKRVIVKYYNQTFGEKRSFSGNYWTKEISTENDLRIELTEEKKSLILDYNFKGRSEGRSLEVEKTNIDIRMYAGYSFLVNIGDTDSISSSEKGNLIFGINPQFLSFNKDQIWLGLDFAYLIFDNEGFDDSRDVGKIGVTSRYYIKKEGTSETIPYLKISPSFFWIPIGELPEIGGSIGFGLKSKELSLEVDYSKSHGDNGISLFSANLGLSIF